MKDDDKALNRLQEDGEQQLKERLKKVEVENGNVLELMNEENAGGSKQEGKPVRKRLLRGKTIQIELFDNMQISAADSDAQKLNTGDREDELTRTAAERDTLSKQSNIEAAIHSEAKEERERVEKFQIHQGQVARLKYKCLVSILSILEGNQSRKDLVSRITRVVPVSVLTENLARIYTLHTRYSLNLDYNARLFRRMEVDLESMAESPDYSELIIESGFLIYTLVNLFISNNGNIPNPQPTTDLASS